MIIDGRKISVFCYSNRIKVTRNGFLPIYNSVFVSFFDSTFGDAFFIKNYISAFSTIYEWCYQVAINIGNVCSLLFDGSNSFWSKITFNFWINSFQNFSLIFVKRSSRISFYTADSLAFAEVTYKFFRKNIFRN